MWRRDAVFEVLNYADYAIFYSFRMTFWTNVVNNIILWSWTLIGTLVLTWMYNSVLTEAAKVVALSHELRWSYEKANNLEELKLEEFANALIRALPKFTAANFFEEIPDVLYWIQVGTIEWPRKKSYTNVFQISNDSSRHVRASIVIHKKKILANKWRIGNHMRFYIFQDVPMCRHCAIFNKHQIEKDTETGHLDQLLTCYDQIRPSRESMCFTEPPECVLHSTSRLRKPKNFPQQLFAESARGQMRSNRDVVSGAVKVRCSLEEQIAQRGSSSLSPYGLVNGKRSVAAPPPQQISTRSPEISRLTSYVVLLPIQVLPHRRSGTCTRKVTQSKRRTLEQPRPVVLAAFGRKSLANR
ncbi:hypothetical protein GEV33_001610 [Tenebrio molitor]|uniref:Uncharacterized protein n=1 Tax=Tenebrio molitor TaxID=7067 RepID=A0A8J6LQ18_TENMO|nr:hypothetical protein GEV33_001610 [Tenebrio molitor]